MQYGWAADGKGGGNTDDVMDGMEVKNPSWPGNAVRDALAGAATDASKVLDGIKLAALLAPGPSGLRSEHIREALAAQGWKGKSDICNTLACLETATK